DHADRRRRVHSPRDVAVDVLVVEAHVPAGDGRTQREAGLFDAVDGLGQLVVHARVGGVAEVEVVRDAQRFGPNATEVAGRLRDRVGGAQTGAQVNVARVAVDGGGDAAARALDAQHGGIGAARQYHGVRHDLVVVPPVDRFLAGDGGGREEGQQRTGRVGHLRHAAQVAAARGQDGVVLTPLPHVLGRPVQSLDRHGGDDLAAFQQAQLAVVPHHADPGRLEAETVEQAQQLHFATRLGGGPHAFLRFGQHDLEGSHALLAPGDRVEVEVHALAGTVSHLGDAGGQAGGAHVLHTGDEVAGERLEAGLE